MMIVHTVCKHVYMYGYVSARMQHAIFCANQKANMTRGRAGKYFIAHGITFFFFCYASIDNFSDARLLFNTPYVLLHYGRKVNYNFFNTLKMNYEALHKLLVILSSLK